MHTVYKRAALIDHEMVGPRVLAGGASAASGGQLRQAVWLGKMDARACFLVQFNQFAEKIIRTDKLALQPQSLGTRQGTPPIYPRSQFINSISPFSTK